MRAHSSSDRVVIRGCALTLICAILLGIGLGEALARPLGCLLLGVVACLVVALLLDSTLPRPDVQQPDIPASVLAAAQQRFHAALREASGDDTRLKQNRHDLIV